MAETADPTENNLQCPDAFGKMCADIRTIAQELGHGTLYYPTMRNPSLVMEVHDGLIKQTDVLFENATLDENDKPILPEHKARYRAD